eukprot:6014599-Prymnesium_polylepis.1
MFGELSLLMSRPVSADVIANPEFGCSVQMLEATEFDKLRHEFPEMLLGLATLAREQGYEELSPFPFDVPLLKMLSGPVVKKIISKLQRHVLKQGEVLIPEGAPVQSLFIAGSSGLQALAYAPGAADGKETRDSSTRRYSTDSVLAAAAKATPPRSSRRSSSDLTLAPARDSAAMTPKSARRHSITDAAKALLLAKGTTKQVKDDD